MINVQKFIDDVTAAFRSGKTQSDIQANAQKALDVLRAGVDAALENANRDDRDEIRRLLGDAQSGLKGIDFDYIHVAPSKANAVRRALCSQIEDFLRSISPSEP
jgi:hypothetical protein